MLSCFKRFLPKNGINDEKLEEYCAEYEYRSNKDISFISFLQNISHEF